MFKRPLVVFTLIFCLGILTGSRVSPGFWLVYSLAVVLLLLSIFYARNIAIILSMVFCLGLAWIINYQALPANHITNYILTTKSNCIVRGFIKSDPVSTGAGTRFILRAEEIELGHKRFICSGDIMVYTKVKTGLRYGEGLVLRGVLYRHGLFRVSGFSSLVKFGRNRGSPLIKFSLAIKEIIRKTFYHYLSSSSAAIVSAMVLGDKKDISPLIYRAMIKTGTVHILVVSGFNVGIVVFIAVIFLKIIRIPRKERFFISAAIIILYCLITGASNPVLRATVMAIAFLFAYLVKREPDIYNSLALAALFILILNPRQLFDLGFQLSFSSVLSIAYLYPRLKQLSGGMEKIKSRAIKFVAEGALVSLAAWLGTAGLIAYYFKIFSPVAILANILIVPLAALITLCGFGLVAVALIMPCMAVFCAKACELAVLLLLVTQNSIVRIPFACIKLG